MSYVLFEKIPITVKEVLYKLMAVSLKGICGTEVLDLLYSIHLSQITPFVFKEAYHIGHITTNC